MQRWTRNEPTSRIIVAVVLVLALFAQLVPVGAHAGFQESFIRTDRMKASTATGGQICVKPATTGTESKLLVTFPTGYTVNGTAANWTVTSTANMYGSSSVWPGIGTASNVTGQVVTFPSGDLTVGTMYCFEFAATNTLTTGSAAPSQQASLETQTSGSVRVDYTQVALAVVADDQILVTAVVPPSFIFTLDGNADAFSANLTPTAGAGGIVSTGGRTVTVTTNAKGGWIAWAKDSNQGLNSPTANYTIPASGTVNGSPSTINGGVEGYVMDVDLTTDATGGCTLAIDGEYNGTGTNQGGTLSGSFQPIAACTGTPPATANGDVITLVERATISGATPAGSDYADTITVVGAGNF